MCVTISIMKTTQILYELDPMRIGTVERGLIDEYRAEAKVIDILSSNGMSITDAVVRSFNQRFWVGCLNADTVQKIVDQIEENRGVIHVNQEIA